MSTMQFTFIFGKNKFFALITKSHFYIWALFLLFTNAKNLKAQDINLSNLAYTQNDVEILYRNCNNLRVDTFSRICMSYLDEQKIRKENVPAFYSFCKDFIALCNKKRNKLLMRRMAIIELYGHLRFDSASVKFASTSFENLHEKYIVQKDYDAALECLLELSNYLHAQNENIKALQVLFYAEKFAVKNKLEQKISYQGVLDRIGYKLWQLNKPQQSIQYFKRAIATGNSNNRDSLIELNGIGINYQKLDSFQQSLQYFSVARKIALSNNNNVFSTVILGSTAATLLKMSDLNLAYDYSMQYKNLSIQYPLWDNAVDAFYNLIQIELKRNNIAHAKILLDSLDGIMNKISSTNYISLKRHKEASWLYFEKSKLFEKALFCHKQYVYYDSLFQDYSNKNKISELELNASAKLYEQEMFEKEQARLLKDMLKTGIVIVLIITMLFFSIWGFKKIKIAQKQKEEAEINNQKQADEIEILKAQLLKQLADIRMHNAGYETLETQNLNFTVNKDNCNLNDNTLPATITMENNFSFYEDTTPIQLLKAFDLTQKEQWKEFKILFTKTYPDFEDQIFAKALRVSTAELRLMMLLKLNLNNKQIAETLLITIDGVKKAKYRLYKKLQVNTFDELKKLL